jgi:hypothetical protein
VYLAKRVLFVFLLSFTMVNPILAAKRVALVIGNSAYQHVAPLKNPKNDAATMASSLKKVGFEVTIITDADAQKMKSAFLQFGRQLRKGVDASVFYYAGHAVQYNGENYLIPTPAKILDRDELDFEAVNINSLMRLLNVASNSVNMVILDACRNNPFPAATRSTSRGLAPVSAPRGTYIAYSTAPGNVALDGDGENSEYTKALATAITEPGLEIAQGVRKVRRAVISATDEKQVPWESSSIVGNFYFKKAEPKPIVIATPKPSPEILASRAWRELRNSKDKIKLQAFLEQHKNTVFADLAMQQLALLAPKKVVEAPIATSEKVSPEVLAAREWRKIRGAKDQSVLNQYLSNHGDSEFADLARRQLALLQPKSNLAPKVLTSRERELVELESKFTAAQRVNTHRGWQLFLTEYGHIETAEKKALEELSAISGGKVPSLVSPKNQEKVLNLSSVHRKAIQSALLRIGFDPGTPDGQFGTNSRKAISAFQASKGWKPTGYVTPNLLKSINIKTNRPSSGKFRSGASASLAKYEDLEKIGEDPRIIEILRCFEDKLLIYGRFGKSIYVAVMEIIYSNKFGNLNPEEGCDGHLVAIGSSAENDFVYNLFSDDQRFFSVYKSKHGTGKKGPLIGLYQKSGKNEPKGGWSWVNSEPLKFRNWAAYQPDDGGGNQNFARFWGQAKKSVNPHQIKADKWDDSGVSSISYVMEFPL